jgi:hypothetical protein
VHFLYSKIPNSAATCMVLSLRWRLSGNSRNSAATFRLTFTLVEQTEQVYVYVFDIHETTQKVE